MNAASDFNPENIRAGLSSPSPAMRWFLYTIVAFVLLLVLMVCFGKLDRTAVAHGRLIPSGHSRAVQAPLGGIVRDVRVAEGQKVVAGQDLVVLVERASDAGLEAAAMQVDMSKLELTRVESQIAGRPWTSPPQPTNALAAKVGARHRAETAAQEALMAQESHALRRLTEDRAAAEASVDELVELTVRHQAEEAAMARLVAKGHVSRLQVLAKERERISSEQQLVAARHRLEGARQAVDQQHARVRSVESDYIRRLESERIDLLRSIQDGSAQLVEAQLAHDATRLTAPVSGVIVDLVALGPGQVLQAGETVLTVVPDDQSLHAEVWLENEDASQVREGQLARLKVMAVDFRRFGAIDSEVVQVAAEATPAPAPATANGVPMADPALPSHAFKARIVPGTQVSGRRFGTTPLRPGMRVTAEIVIGRRSVLEYLLSPVVQTLDEAGKET